MTVRKLRMMCAAGDETLAEWETETISPQRLNEIEVEFQSKMRRVLRCKHHRRQEYVHQ